MKYAVLQLKNKQYLIKPGQILKIDNLGVSTASLETDKVMLLADDNGKIAIGRPFLKKKLEFEIVGARKTKIKTLKYKAKSNYRRSIGQLKTTSFVKLKA